MYSLSPYYEDNVEVLKLTCMYDMKNINEKYQLQVESPTSNAITSTEMTVCEKNQAANLEKRQISLINQLNDLTLLLKNIKGKLLAGPPNTIGPVVHPLKRGELLDIIIYAPPTYNLLALLLLSEWLKKQCFVSLNIYFHSSLKKINERYLHLSKYLECKTSNSRSSTQLIITVIIKKDVDLPLLRISQTQRTLVAGEINIIRFLATLMWPQNNFEDPVHLTEVDQWLDLAHDNYLGNRNDKEILNILNSHLSRNNYLVGEVFSIADIGFLNFISRPNAPKILQNVKRWKDNCFSDPAVKCAWTALMSNC